MKKAILFTGTPGTGKTSIAKKIAKHYDYEYVHIGDKKEYVEEETDTKIIDIKKMIKWLKNKQEDNEKRLVIDSHLSHYYPANRTRQCIITRCEPTELKTRLKKRNYNDDKIKINIEAEAMDLILQEAIMEGHRIYEINTTHRTTSNCTEEVIKAINNNETREGIVDYSKHLIKLKKKKQ